MTTLHDLDVDEFLASCVHIEPMALSEEFVRLPADFAYWNERFAKASRLHASTKQQRERIYSQLLLENRMASEAVPQLDPNKSNKHVKMTVGEIEARITLDPAYQTAREAEVDAEIDAERINGVLQALRTKKDMLVQMGYQQRAEMSSDPSVRDYVNGESMKRGF